MYVWMYVCKFMYVWMYVWMYVCMYVCGCGLPIFTFEILPYHFINIILDLTNSIRYIYQQYQELPIKVF